MDESHRKIFPILNSEASDKLAKSIVSGNTPILIYGVAGMGKSTLLAGVARNWKSGQQPVFFCSLREVDRETDLFMRLRREFPDVLAEEELVIASSADRVIDSCVQLIKKMPTKPLILLDGLDETRNTSAIARFVERVAQETKAVVVVSARAFDGHLASFEDVIGLSPLSRRDFSRFVASRIGEATLDDRDEERLWELSQGVPLAAELVVASRDRILGGHSLSPHMLKAKDSTLAELLKIHVDQVLSELISETERQAARVGIALLAVRGRMSHSDLIASGAFIPDKLLNSSVILADGEHRLLPPAIAPILLSIIGIAPRRGACLGDLRFGAEEAERDQLLDRTFIKVAGFEQVRKGDLSIVVGDRGTGKSAIFSHLNIPNGTTSNRLISFVTHPDDLLRRLQADGNTLLTAEQFKAGWITLAAHAITTHAEAVSTSKQRRVAARLRELLADETEHVSLFRKIWKTLSGTSIKIGVGPVSIERSSGQSKHPQSSSGIDIKAFIQSVGETLASKGKVAIVAFDRIDEIHKYDRKIQQSAVQGLFLAEADVAQFPGINLLVFIRSDLFNLYDIQEKNKLVSRRLDISWNKEVLFRFVVERVLSNECLAGLNDFRMKLPNGGFDFAFDAIFPREVEGKRIKDWIWESIANGNGSVSPRQLVLLLILAIKAPGASVTPLSGFPVFPTDAVRIAMDELSKLSFSELVDDFRLAQTFLANCRAGKISQFKLEDVTNLFGSSDGEISLQVNQLERLGFLERIVLQKEAESKQILEFRVPPIFTRGWSVA